MSEENQIEEQEEQFENDGDLLEGLQDYKTPSDETAVIDTEKGEVIDAKSLTPLQQLQFIADKMQMKLVPPNPNCTRPGCYGRGFVGFDNKTKAPVPCKCIFEKADQEKMAESTNPAFWNRAQRRKIEKMALKRKKQINRKEQLEKDNKADVKES